MSSAKNPQVVGARYDQVAPIYGLLEWLQGFPVLGVRRKSVEALELGAGETVLEVGCGDGRNFDYMRAAVGPNGTLIGVDASAGMLARAGRRVESRGWSNVLLTHGDAAAFEAPQPYHAAMFCLSYCNLQNRESILRHAWRRLLPGGRLVLSDIALSPGLGRRLLMRPAQWICEHTLFGDAQVDLAKDLAEVAGATTLRTVTMVPGLIRFSICAARKPTTPA